MGDESYPKLTIRVPSETLRRLDSLVPRLAQDRAIPGAVRPNRSTAARLALEVGLAVLEDKHGAGRKRR